MTKKYDTIDFKIQSGDAFDGYYVAKCDRAILLINGKPFIETVKEIEDAITVKNFYCPSGNYNYLPPKKLYEWLKDAETDSDPMVYLLCCPECDEEGCASVVADVEYTADSVIWKNFGNMYEHEFDGLRYEFKRSDYEAFMNKLKDAE